MFANVAWVNNHPYAYYFSAWYWLVAAVALVLWHWKGQSIAVKLRRKRRRLAKEALKG